MAKKKNKAKTNAIRIIEQKNIAYDLYEIPWDDEFHSGLEISDKIGVNPDIVFKTIVTVGNKSGLIVAVLPSSCELDLKKLATVSGNKRVELLPLVELESATGYIRGGCSPVGMKKSYPTYISDLALKQEKIIISAGKRGMQLAMSPVSLGKITDGEMVDITV